MFLQLTNETWSPMRIMHDIHIPSHNIVKPLQLLNCNEKNKILKNLGQGYSKNTSKKVALKNV